jgi:hypothetical protein
MRADSNRGWPYVGALVLAAMQLAACSSAAPTSFDGGPGDAAPDASDNDGGAGGGGTIVRGCNGTVNTADVVYLTRVADTAPIPLGGTPVAGTYHLTAWRSYTGPGGASGPTTQGQKLTAEMTVSGQYNVTMLISVSRPGGTDVHQTTRMMLTGTGGQFAYSCPAATAMQPISYTATANEFRLFLGLEYVYTKQ